MTVLDIVLAVKILGTGLFVAFPLLALPSARVSDRLGISLDAVPYLRLYGVSIAALLVGYSFGFSWIVEDEFPLGIVCMGIVSNGVGTLVMVANGLHRTNQPMAILIGSIATMLLVCLFLQDLAMTRF